MKPIQMFFALCIALIPFLEGKEFSLNTPVCANYANAGQSITQENLDGIPVLRFIFDSAKMRWGEFYWTDNVKTLPSFQTLKVLVRMRKENGEWPTSMRLRIADKNREIFQFDPKEIKFETSEKCTAVYEVSATGKQKSFWGGDGNGIIDQPCWIQGMAAVFSEKTGKCDVLITGITWETQETQEIPSPKTAVSSQEKNPAEKLPFRLDLKTSHPVPVVGPEEKEFYAYITNSGNRYTCFNISFTIRDAEGKTVFQQPAFPAFIFQKSQECPQFFLLPVPEKYGLYDVEAIAQSKEDPEIKWVAHRTFAKLCSTELLPSWKNGDFRFGIDQNKIGNDPSRAAAAAGLAGAAFLRLSCSATSFWPESDTEYAGGLLYLFKELKKNNIYPAAIIWATYRPWMYEKEEDRKKPGHHMIHPDIWREYCDRVFRALGKYVHHFEVWNEPDTLSFASFHADDYYRLAKIAREELDRNLPDAELMSAGFCNFGGKDRLHEKAMSLCRDLFDTHCFHGHAAYLLYRNIIDRHLLPMRRKIGIDQTIPWFPHETGLTDLKYGTHLQAVTLFQKLIFSWSRGAIGYTWYCLRDPGRNPTDPEHHYGLFDYDYYPKEVFCVYRMLSQTFRGATSFVRSFPENNITESYLFRRGNDLLIPAWNRKAYFTGNELIFSTDAKEAEIIDLYGNVTPLKIVDSTVRLPLGADPVTLRLKQARYCNIADGLCRLARSEADLSADSVPCTLNFTNPNETSGTFTLKADIPEGLRAEIPESVAVPGKQTLQKTFTITVDPKANLSSATQQINFHYSLNGVPRGTASFYLTPALLMNESFPEKPSAVLNTRAQMVELFDADPQNVFRLRKDDNDLSANVWIASDAENLRFRILVTDDVHHQKEEAKTLWKGDSLQLYLAVPGQPDIWEINVALHEDGRILKKIWATGNRSAADDSRVKADITRKGTQTEYLISLPWKMLGAEEHILRYNLLINESDSDCREGMMRLAPGVGEGMNDVLHFHILKEDRSEK